MYTLPKLLKTKPIMLRVWAAPDEEEEGSYWFQAELVNKDTGELLKNSFGSEYATNGYSLEEALTELDTLFGHEV